MDFDHDIEAITPNPGVILTFGGSSGVRIPGGLVAERPSTPAVGTLRYRTDAGAYETYNGTNWSTMVSNLQGTSNQINVTSSLGQTNISLTNDIYVVGSLSYGTLQGHPLQVVTSSGTTQSTAALITKSTTVVSSGASLSGVILPTPSLTGQMHRVLNQTSATILVYPHLATSFFGKSINTPETIPTGYVLTLSWTGSAWHKILDPINASDVIGFDNRVRTTRLDQLAAPTNSLNVNNQLLTNVQTPVSPSDSATKQYVDQTFASVMISRKTFTIGDGASTSHTVTHNLSTYDIYVEVYDTVTRSTVLCDVTRSSVNTAVISFVVPPAQNAFTVVVMG